MELLAPASGEVAVDCTAGRGGHAEAIARQLDGGSGATFFTLAMKNGNATDVAQSLQTVLGEGTRVAADARSNTVIVRGTPASVAEARKMLISLDQPGGATPITRMQ